MVTKAYLAKNALIPGLQSDPTIDHYSGWLSHLIGYMIHYSELLILSWSESDL